MTSGAFAPLADLLAEQRTVVTYDPHGLGLSTVDDPSLAVTPEIQADDLAEIVDAVGGGPADVFASSGGAVAGLAFAARHPAKVRTLVAHEPPVTELLADAARVRTAVDEIEQAYRDHGAAAAWGTFISLVVLDGPVPETGVPAATWPPQGSPRQEDDGKGAEEGKAGHEDDAAVASAEPSAKQRADNELFFLRMLKPFTRYQPEVQVLRSGAPRVVIAVGEASRTEVAPRSARALAELLNTPATVFPGDHAGFLAHPTGFAERLRQVLSTHA
jgi:pimeloyl-ACP methyl ester carboxylesterase